MHRLLLTIGIFLFLLSATVVRAEELNAGFVQGLWYGTKTVIAGQPTRIYVALRNNTDSDLTGTVRFTDNGSRIGVAYVSALPGRIVEAWIDWTPRYGEHAIAASLTNVQVYAIGEAPTAGEIENTIAQSTLFVDYDTDGDGIPNEKDLDDDNDTVSDIDEIARGTDPLKTDITEKKEEPEDPTSQANTEKQRELKQEASVITAREGLESYIPNPNVRNAVSSLTDTITETRASLDSYRKEREDSIKEYFKQSPTTMSTDDSSATITRSQLQNDESFIESVVRGGKALVGGLYSFLLLMASSALAYPALIELILLVLIVYVIYRTARRFGRRRNTN